MGPVGSVRVGGKVCEEMQGITEEAVSEQQSIHYATGGWGQFMAQTACGEISSVVYATINPELVSCEKCILNKSA